MRCFRPLRLGLNEKRSKVSSGNNQSFEAYVGVCDCPLETVKSLRRGAQTITIPDEVRVHGDNIRHSFLYQNARRVKLELNDEGALRHNREPLEVESLWVLSLDAVKVIGDLNDCEPNAFLKLQRGVEVLRGTFTTCTVALIFKFECLALVRFNRLKGSDNRKHAGEGTEKVSYLSVLLVGESLFVEERHSESKRQVGKHPATKRRDVPSPLNQPFEKGHGLA